ncbi:hypothetical protein CLAFUW4_08074 [Fulvia fulva]|uniref:Uncharacterized protein n=1 Tax=Passalora fulva TaxID=5499 RepID=A0A9Q8LCM5_PASFU|nr:uncharacterized protein CLAFUR5_08192 [Fulvia fulva]KAK4629320.1 hypothetical protein CLAFUR4_08079 [Fulvia fulva]KAK4630443.1 hypothetical protein CLAFUR0_08074 [Fulvia fulva]UJO14920.1 hypothetical protein CLAFUR5_08192 [Fulvia fulva]WPV12827.1 hypothetical protein CLAFUW4_08074 [Fulvia fulva]WPV27004.1 hypothetical protein CLAFUW7_08074 [Fulvia fulva]
MSEAEGREADEDGNGSDDEDEEDEDEDEDNEDEDNEDEEDLTRTRVRMMKTKTRTRVRTMKMKASTMFNMNGGTTRARVVEVKSALRAVVISRRLRTKRISTKLLALLKTMRRKSMEGHGNIKASWT